MFQSVALSSSRSRTAPDALVVGHFKGQAPDKATRDLHASIAGAAKRPEASGDAGRIVEVYPEGRGAPKRIILVGLGAKGSFAPGVMRDVGAAVGRRLAAIDASKVEVDFGGAVSGAKADANACGEAFGEAVGLLAWTRHQFKGSASPDAGKGLARLALRCADKRFGEGVSWGLALAESANAARTLSETPPNICTPAFVASEARKLARATGMKCTVIRGESALEAQGLAGLANVGKASENEPCLVRLEYRPARVRRGAKPAVLVGKTITYDSGGLSLKINNSMRGMKRDMDGGAAIFGAMHAVATLVKPNRPVVGLLACAENSISDEAYRPDDVLTFRNGVTVEVTNTDAEGRLVLADALCWASEEEDPAFIIDTATLTGGVVVALGSTYAGMWCDDDKLRAKIEAAADRSGERVWRLPLHKEYRDLMKSDIADILNSAPVRAAHPIQGAAFLSYFVGEGIPWAHIDIAGVHSVDSEKGPYIKNSATGFGVRLLADLIDAG